MIEVTSPETSHAVNYQRNFPIILILVSTDDSGKNIRPSSALPFTCNQKFRHISIPRSDFGDAAKKAVQTPKKALQTHKKVYLTPKMVFLTTETALQTSKKEPYCYYSQLSISLYEYTPPLQFYFTSPRIELNSFAILIDLLVKTLLNQK